jgi:multidrug efflux pump subunit AcrA (membrane-fusion protein)
MPDINQKSELADKAVKIINTVPEDLETEQRHTDEMQEIIGAPPSWLLRWGITVYFVVLVSILGLAEFINYPDIVKTQLKVRSSNLPQPVIVKTPGKLVKLLVQNNQAVKEGQTLAIIGGINGSTILTAPVSGKLSYGGIIHEGQELSPNQTMFYITINDTNFFGEIIIPQGSMGKVKAGQEVMIKLQSYPYQEYGILHGTVKYITGDAFKDSLYIAEVDFKTKNLTDMHKPLDLKQGMTAEAEIITENSTLFKRMTGNILKNISH